MDKLIDDVARIFATPIDRRKTLRLLGGAIAAALVGTLGSTSLSAAQCTQAQTTAGGRTCGKGGNVKCCEPGTCCASNGSAGSQCCKKGECVCPNGTCGASTGGVCPSSCTKC